MNKSEPLELSERIRTCMTTPMTDFSVDGPKNKWTFQLIEEQLWVADEVEQLEVENAELLELLEEAKYLILKLSIKAQQVSMWETITGRIDAYLLKDFE